MFGIAIGKRFPRAKIVALDWSNVLQVAEENANRAQLDGRYNLQPGSAFDLNWGTGFDVVLMTNFLHHFDRGQCEALLRRAHAALAPDGRLFTLEFVPDEDRLSPPRAAAFSLTMLATTPAGDAYTFSELDTMLRNAGFSHNQIQALPVGIEQLVISRK
jgi:cyclopropane fatty-acyl-phospholipid synthase-like methyltransferase